MPHNPYHARFNPKLSIGITPRRKRPSGIGVPRRPKGKQFSWKRTRSKMQQRPGYGMRHPEYLASLKRALKEARIPLDEWNELNYTEREQVLEELIRTLPSIRQSSGMAKLRKKGAENPAHTAMLLFKNAGVLRRNLTEGDESNIPWGTAALEDEKRKEREEREKTPHITPTRDRKKRDQNVQEILGEHRVEVDPYQQYDYKP